jgi:hypothetical protein
MAKDKYIDLADHPGVRIRVERLDGIPPSNYPINAQTGASAIWWDRELIAFLTNGSPLVRDIVTAEAKLLAAIAAVDLDASSARAEVVMFHGTFVKAEIWCPAGTAARLGIKGYAK